MNGWTKNFLDILERYKELLGQWDTARKAIEGFSPGPDLPYTTTQAQGDSVDLIVMFRHVRIRFYTKAPQEGSIVYFHVTTKNGHDVEHEIDRLEIDHFGNVERSGEACKPEWHAAVLAKWLEASDQ